MNEPIKLGVQPSKCPCTWDYIIVEQGSLRLPRVKKTPWGTEYGLETHSLSLADFVQRLARSRGYSYESRREEAQRLDKWLDKADKLPYSRRTEALADLVGAIVGEGAFALATDEEIAFAISKGDEVKKEKYLFVGVMPEGTMRFDLRTPSYP
jgi:hypothetical protein